MEYEHTCEHSVNISVRMSVNMSEDMSDTKLECSRHNMSTMRPSECIMNNDEILNVAEKVGVSSASI